jgi:hypothetical protein
MKFAAGDRKVEDALQMLLNTRGYIVIAGWEAHTAGQVIDGINWSTDPLAAYYPDHKARVTDLADFIDQHKALGVTISNDALSAPFYCRVIAE